MVDSVYCTRSVTICAKKSVKPSQSLFQSINELKHQNSCNVIRDYITIIYFAPSYGISFSANWKNKIKSHACI